MRVRGVLGAAEPFRIGVEGDGTEEFDTDFTCLGDADALLFV